MNDSLEPPQTKRSCLAVFDFDATLAKGDSLWPFLIKAVGRPKCYWAFACAAMCYLTHLRTKDSRTLIKKVLLEKTLKGERLETIEEAINEMEHWPCWMKTIDELKRHHKAGHHILIASGGLDLYIKSMLKSLPYDDILCTEMEVINGTLTGRMASGNCVRQSKAARVKEYMETHGPFSESWGYGNEPHDLPMMAHLDRGIVVEKE